MKFLKKSAEKVLNCISQFFELYIPGSANPRKNNIYQVGTSPGMILEKRKLIYQSN